MWEGEHKQMKITIVSNIDDKGKTYWTASFGEIPNVVGGGNTPKDALNEGLENLKDFEDHLNAEEFDEIFLLSAEEYKKYEPNILRIRCWWWLRSPGLDSHSAACVYSGGSVDDLGHNVFLSNGAVRPALRISNLESSNLKVGDRFVKYDFPWIKIDDNLAIAEVPIRFHSFDEKSNDYKTSEIRKFLLNWIDERKDK